MEWGDLAFLAEPWFVIPWYGFGLAAAGWIVYDTLRVNTNVNAALKGAWPIVAVFFSVVGLLLYLWTCRPPGIGAETGEEAERAHHDYVDRRFRKVTGSVIHCVGGDGLGIMTAMVFARLAGMTFWDEFWFEYAVGFAFGWLLFQTVSFLKMEDAGLPSALWKGFRGEFFSMITVMLGMGAVMRYVTPRVVGGPPTPDTAAFWGFGALGLFVGFLATYPTNWWLVRVGWKHGMA